jgi:hypothetical protein
MAILRTLVVIAGTLAAVTAHAATITQQFDLLLLGDDPSEVFELSTPFLLNSPLAFSFTGFGERLNPPPYENQTLRVVVSNEQPQFEFLEFVLPAADPPLQVPLVIDRSFTTTNGGIRLIFEGTGPGDNIHIVGTATLTGTVPEPSTLAILLAALPLALLFRLQRLNSAALPLPRPQPVTNVVLPPASTEMACLARRFT